MTDDTQEGLSDAAAGSSRCRATNSASSQYAQMVPSDDDRRCAEWLAERPGALAAAALSYAEQRDVTRTVRNRHPLSRAVYGLVPSSSDRQGMHRRCLLRVDDDHSLSARTNERIERIVLLAKAMTRGERFDG